MGDYDYYYRPYVSVASAVEYLVATLFSEALEDRRQSRLDEEQIAADDATHVYAADARSAQNLNRRKRDCG